MINRLGRNGLNELKSHAWFHDIEWNNIHTQNAPYLPENSNNIKRILKELSSIQNNNNETINDKLLITELTQNFDTFKDENVPWTIKTITSTNTTPNNSNKTNNTITRKTANDEFLGYTFRRKKVIKHYYLILSNVVFHL